MKRRPGLPRMTGELTQAAHRADYLTSVARPPLPPPFKARAGGGGPSGLLKSRAPLSRDFLLNCYGGARSREPARLPAPLLAA